ncbi:hypothetical protein AX14_005262 [Amanita brunnescens Koide BX004]|nr:hypothetical protein AX14_005262 [Amanita brunnescens Koide BX004]
MHVMASLPFVLLLANVALGHGDGGPDSEVMQAYASRRLASRHRHIFFKLHDLKCNGFLYNDEYGVRYGYAKALSKDDQEQNRNGENIVQDSLPKIGDVDKISPELGFKKSPNFNLGAEGHHESQLFRHEERYHNALKPETAGGSNYYPQDLEHCSRHEKTEQEEVERPAKLQSVSIEEVLEYKGDRTQFAQLLSDIEKALLNHSDDIHLIHGLTYGTHKPPVVRTPITTPTLARSSIKYKEAKAEVMKKVSGAQAKPVAENQLKRTHHTR